MNKFLSAVVVALFLSISSVAMAVEVSVQPGVSGRAYNRFETVAEVGAKVIASQLPYVPAEVEVATGLNWAGTQLSGTDINVDLYTIPLEIGYNYAINKDFSVKPTFGFDFILADSSADVNDTVGERVGVEVAYKVSENVKVSANVGYAFASTEVNGTKEDLSGPVFGGAATYSF